MILLMLHIQMMGIVVMTGDRDNDIKSVASVLNEIGVGGLNVEVATDNERYFVDMVSRGLAKSNARAYHWKNISEYRPQTKGVERAVCVAKEGIYTNWLAFESKCQCRIALESPLVGYLVGYVEDKNQHLFRLACLDSPSQSCWSLGRVKEWFCAVIWG